MTTLHEAAQQALEALEMCRLNGSQYLYGNERDLIFSAIKALRAALARQAEPEELTMERLRDALVASRIIPPAAVEDPEGYDDGVTLFRIEALHRRIT